MLEASVVGSFTRIGYHARRRLYRWPPVSSFRLDGRVALVTGATSGLGRYTAETMARLGADVVLVGRDPERTERARREIAAVTQRDVTAELADLSLLADAAALADRVIATHDRLDVLVHNAGAMTHRFVTTAEGNESTFATHVLAQFLITARLLPLVRQSPDGRVITVASGGMYTQPLDVRALEPSAASYDGVKAYSRCKRAQVALAGEWARRTGGHPGICTMHPGWADTPGIRDALPGFSRLVGPLLRTPAEGADTILWLAAGTPANGLGGRFFHDRRARPLHRLRRTRRPDEAQESARLWELCRERTGTDPPSGS